MNDLERGTIVDEVNIIGNTISFNIKLDENGSIESRKISIEKEEGKTILKYGKTSGTSFVTNDKSYYKKELEKSLQIGKISCNKDGSMIKITIGLKSIYDDNDYSIKLIAQKS